MTIFTPGDVRPARALHPAAEVLVHPECRPEVIDLADYVYSTAGMGKHALASPAHEFIIGTETGMIYKLKKENPEKEFYPLSENAICQNMKKTTLEKVLRALQTLEPARHCSGGDRGGGKKGDREDDGGLVWGIAEIGEFMRVLLFISSIS
jgi:quinolinate synthase